MGDERFLLEKGRWKKWEGLHLGCGGGVGDGKNSVMFLVWFVFFLKKIAQRLTFTVETLISLLLITISGFP